MNGHAKTWIALVALTLSLIVFAVKEGQEIQARLTAAEVEHLIDLKVSDKLSEIIRRLDAIERQLAEKR